MSRDMIEIANYYNKLSRSYDMLHREEQMEKFKEVFRKINPDTFIGVCLDVGCGTGLFKDFLSEINQLREKVYYIGIDISEFSIKNSLDKGGLILQDYILCDGEKPPLRIEKVDIIVSFTTIHHFKKPIEFVVNIIDNVKKSLIISVLAMEEWIENLLEHLNNNFSYQINIILLKVRKDIIMIINRIV